MRINQILEASPGLTARSVSLEAGLSDSMIHKFLTGGTKSMTVDNLERVAEALGVNPRWLIFGDAPRFPDPKLAHIWDHIPERRRKQALKVLEAFADEDESQTG